MADSDEKQKYSSSLQKKEAVVKRLRKLPKSFHVYRHDIVTPLHCNIMTTTSTTQDEDKKYTRKYIVLYTRCQRTICVVLWRNKGREHREIYARTMVIATCNAISFEKES